MSIEADILRKYRVIAVIGLGAVGFVALVLLWGVLKSNDGDEAAQDRTASDVYSAIEGAVSREGEILHTTLQAEQGGKLLYTVEMWVDGEQGAVRQHVTPVDLPDSDETWTEITVIVTGENSYLQESSGIAKRDQAPTCQGIAEAWLSAFIVCEPDSEARVEDGIWEGQRAVVLIYERSVVIPTPENLVTPQPTIQTEPTPGQVVPTDIGSGGVETFVSMLYLDPATYLPIARTYQQRINGEPVDKFGDPQWTYEHEFLPRTAETLALFDPESIGYETQD